MIPKIPLMDINEFQSNDSQISEILDSQVINTFNPYVQGLSVKDSLMKNVQDSEVAQ